MPRSPFPSSLEPGPHLADSQKNGLLTKFLICLIVIASCLMLFPGISQRRYSAGGGWYRLTPSTATPRSHRALRSMPFETDRSFFPYCLSRSEGMPVLVFRRRLSSVPPITATQRTIPIANAQYIFCRSGETVSGDLVSTTGEGTVAGLIVGGWARLSPALAEDGSGVRIASVLSGTPKLLLPCKYGTGSPLVSLPTAST